MYFEKLVECLAEVGREIFAKAKYPFAELDRDFDYEIARQLDRRIYELIPLVKGASKADMRIELDASRQFKGYNVYDTILDRVWVEPVGDDKSRERYVEVITWFVQECCIIYQTYYDRLEAAIFEAVSATPVFPQTELSDILRIQAGYQSMVVRLTDELKWVDGQDPTRLIWLDKHSDQIHPFLYFMRQNGGLTESENRAVAQAFKASFETSLDEDTLRRIDKRAELKKLKFIAKNFAFLSPTQGRK